MLLLKTSPRIWTKVWEDWSVIRDELISAARWKRQMTEGTRWRGVGRVENSQEQSGRDGWTLDIFKQDIFILSCRHEWFSSICYGRKLRDPAGAVQLTGPCPGQPAVHLLSRLDRPAVTHYAVKPWAGVLEMWQHNQFPWFMITPKGGRAERLGSWKRRAEGECWRQQLADVYSSRDSSSGCATPVC